MKIIKVVELIERLEELGYDKNTKICFGFYNCGGDWLDFEVEEIEDGDREVGVDTIGVILKPNKDYTRSILQEANIDLEEDLKNLIQKYC